MKTLIVPSAIAKSQKELDKMLEQVRGKATRIMLDIMDGRFVSNRSLDFDFKVPEGFEYEAHLMVQDPLAWVERNSGKVDIVIFHVETLTSVEEALKLARQRGLRSTLALNPETELDAVLPYLGEVEAVLIMTVKPGSFCVEFLPETLEKIRRLREISDEIPIEVDGCMNLYHVRLARDAGANIFDSGSHVMKSPDPGAAIRELEEVASGRE